MRDQLLFWRVYSVTLHAKEKIIRDLKAKQGNYRYESNYWAPNESFCNPLPPHPSSHLITITQHKMCPNTSLAFCVHNKAHLVRRWLIWAWRLIGAWWEAFLPSKNIWRSLSRGGWNDSGIGTDWGGGDGNCLSDWYGGVGEESRRHDCGDGRWADAKSDHRPWTAGGGLIAVW
jgi:hypothetical protein